MGGGHRVEARKSGLWAGRYTTNELTDRWRKISPNRKGQGKQFTFAFYFWLTSVLFLHIIGCESTYC